MTFGKRGFQFLQLFLGESGPVPSAGRIRRDRYRAAAVGTAGGDRARSEAVGEETEAARVVGRGFCLDLPS